MLEICFNDGFQVNKKDGWNHIPVELYEGITIYK